MEHALRPALLPTLPQLVLRGVDARHNMPAVIMLAAAGGLFVLSWAAASVGSGDQFPLFLIGNLIGLALLLTGYSAAGVMLMDQARGRPPRSVGDTLRAGAVCALRHAVLAFFAAVGLALFALCVAMALLLARIPGLGVLFYLLLFPLASLGSAALFGLGGYAFLLLGPALWCGAGVRQAALHVWAVFQHKPRQVLIACTLLTVLTAVLVLAGGAVAAAGTVFVGGLSVPMLGEVDDFSGLFATPAQHLASGVTALSWAGVVGAGLVYAAIGAFVAAVMILGTSHAWLHLTRDLDLEQAGRAFDDPAFDDAGEERGSLLAAPSAAHALVAAGSILAHAAHTAAGLPPPAEGSCHRCGAGPEPGDRFCTACGCLLTRP
ncbi:zinc ribbon domain-containing protein [Azoarcus olearius]|uniref:Hypothetical membrane protein n=1 Tax=Azoarcus sp. (strain BH72) TaxID=418699 RepID=A1K200_AZOSB|nr:zinc ribbon domain-containing protein [Azoarcus olearius]CAL92855.1 hypothetical membrane protein [Azoarcus olearius]